jgi:hypothetical protein
MAEELPLNRSFLESVTTAELLKLADRLGIDLPPGLDRAIVIEELLETGDSGRSPGSEMAGGAAENPGTDGVQGERRPLANNPLGEAGDIQDSLLLVEKQQPPTAPLPKHYNISYIEVLIRDPLWAFAFWEINAHDKEIHERAPDFGGYCLKVMPVPGSAAGDSSFTVQVGTGDAAWYLGFPPEGGRFKVELCAIRKNGAVVLAVSKPFRLPILPGSGEAPEAAAFTNPLLRLSGIEDFKILRNTMRSSRLPKRYHAHTGGNAAGVRE